MHPPSAVTRSLLAAAALALAASPLAAQRVPRIAFSRGVEARAVQQCPDTLASPSNVMLGGGRSTTLTMAPDTYVVGGKPQASNIYNGVYLAPTLRIGLGERLVVDVQNRMRPVGNQTQKQVEHTNQHYHGLVVTPLPDTGDNVTKIHIVQGGSNRNSFPLLREGNFQSEGLMWYHPHPHGITDPQVFGGLAGALVVGDLLSHYPEYRGATERIMTLKGTGTSSFSPTLNLNGSSCAQIGIRPGEQQLWRIGNFNSNAFVNLKLPGYAFTVLALDGNRVPRTYQTDSLFIPPGSRVEAIVTGGTGPWVTPFIAAPFPAGQKDTVTLGYLVTRGAQLQALAELQAEERTVQARVDAEIADTLRRLLTAPAVDTFTLRFSFGSNGALLNDSVYNPKRIDRAVEVGSIQEWTLVNETTALHTFHIHQTDFAVVSINGQVPPPDKQYHHDNVLLGVHDNATRGDIVKVRFRFLPIAAGPFVYHCHVLGHEDAGMMQNICVYPKGESASWCNQFYQ